MFILLGILMGLGLPLQTGINARLTHKLGSPYNASFVSFIIAFIFLLLLVFITEQNYFIPFNELAGEPLWIWMGGVCGVIFLTGNIVLFARLGGVQTVIFPVLGQILMGLIIDNFGLFYAPQTDLTLLRVLGAILVLLGVINVVIGLMAVALFPTLTKKFSRRKLFFISITIMLIAIVVYYMAGQNVYMTLLGAGLFALPQPLIFLVVLMTITDSVEYGQLKLGHRDEALVLCVRPLIDKLGGAITSAIVGFTAVWVGMSGKATAASITPENLLNFQLIMFAAPFILIVIAGFIYRAKVSLTEEKHAEIVRELERTWGKDNK